MTQELEAEVNQSREKIGALLEQMGRRLVGQKEVAERLVMGLIAGGHVLLEGLPGLAKTTAVKALADATDLTVSRIQFTPDLLPADVLGTQIYNPQKGAFEIKKGPVFTNLLIADEINRAPAKVQSALLEVMQERQVTLGDSSFVLERPFLVMATQNPIEQEGTYQLPEAQVDRFLFKVNVGYGTADDERMIIDRMVSGEDIGLDQVMTKGDIQQAASLIPRVTVNEKIRDYIVKLVFATRDPKGHGLANLAAYITYGASPRASIYLERMARVAAIFDGRTYVTPQDVKDVAHDILRHRVILTYEAEADEVDTESICREILANVDVP